MPIRDPLRALVEITVPDGLLWLESANLPHPEAARVTELPFVFELGRVAKDLAAPGGPKHTVRETVLVAGALPEDQRDAEHLRTLLNDYARFVVATNPTRHARLTGVALAAYLTSLVKKAKRKPSL